MARAHWSQATEKPSPANTAQKELLKRHRVTYDQWGSSPRLRKERPSRQTWGPRGAAQQTGRVGLPGTEQL